MPKAKTPKKSSSAKFHFKRVVVPDKVDLRDRIYQPAIARRPASKMLPRVLFEVLDQGATNACTGFSLASVVRFLQLAQEPDPSVAGANTAVSSFMLYSMARRYDEFPGSLKDEGSGFQSLLALGGVAAPARPHP